MADVGRKVPGARCSQFKESLSWTSSSSKKGTEMLSSLVKFQTKLAAMRDDRGATAVEYGLMVAMIALVIIVAVTALGVSVKGLFQGAASSI